MLSAKTLSSKRATLVRHKTKRHLAKSPSSAESNEGAASVVETTAEPTTTETSIAKKPKIPKSTPCPDKPLRTAKGKSAKTKANNKTKAKTSKHAADKASAAKLTTSKQYVPCTAEIKEASDAALQQKSSTFNVQSLEKEVGENQVSPSVKAMLAGILQECRTAGCEHHDLHMVECGAIRYDMYYKRSSVG